LALGTWHSQKIPPPRATRKDGSPRGTTLLRRPPGRRSRMRANGRTRASLRGSTRPLSTHHLRDDFGDRCTARGSQSPTPLPVGPGPAYSSRSSAFRRLDRDSHIARTFCQLAPADPPNAGRGTALPCPRRAAARRPPEPPSGGDRLPPNLGGREGQGGRRRRTTPATLAPALLPRARIREALLTTPTRSIPPPVVQGPTWPRRAPRQPDPLPPRVRSRTGSCTDTGRRKDRTHARDTPTSTPGGRSCA